MPSFLADIALISVPEERQREDLGDLDSLARSFRIIGQINPIVVDDGADGTYSVISGERRLAAAKMVGWKMIECLRRTDLALHERHLLELEENIRRKALAWPEELLAIAKYAGLAKKPLQEVAKDLSILPAKLGERLIVAESLADDPELKKSDSWTAALQIVRARKARKTALMEEEIRESVNSGLETESSHPEFLEGNDGILNEDNRVEPISVYKENRGSEGGVVNETNRSGKVGEGAGGSQSGVIQADFIEWAGSYSGRRFNLIHCDFPYGLSMDTADRSEFSPKWEEELYQDTPEHFQALLSALIRHRDRFIADSAHILFWLSPKSWGQVAKMLELCGFVVSTTPLIWVRLNSIGVAPAPRYLPRNNYEMALFAYRGQRPQVKLKDAAFAFSPGRADKDHLSQKPLEVVQHFLSMVCDESSEVLDPTCGTGGALVAAKSLKASRILGLDINPNHVEVARRKMTWEVKQPEVINLEMEF